MNKLFAVLGVCVVLIALAECGTKGGLEARKGGAKGGIKGQAGGLKGIQQQVQQRKRLPAKGGPIQQQRVEQLPIQQRQEPQRKIQQRVEQQVIQQQEQELRYPAKKQRPQIVQQQQQQEY